MEKNNKGFSLVELIVVIAIMAVALTVGSYSLSTIALANSKRCATEIKSALESARIESCRSNGELELSIFKGDDGGVMMQVSGKEPKEISNSAVSVSYKLHKTDDSYISLGTEKLTFVFDRSSGAIKGSSGCYQILVSGGGREYTITCYKNTGKIKME